MKTGSKKAKRRMLFAFILLIVLVGIIFNSTIKDWKQIYNNKKESKKLSSEYNNLLNEEVVLNAEVTKFRDPDYLARYAREKYLYSLPDELIIRLPGK